MPFHRLALLCSSLVYVVLSVASPSVAQDAASAFGATPAAPSATESCRFPADLAERLLSGGLDFGDVPLQADFLIDEQTLLDEGRLRATVEARMESGPLRQAPTATLCVFLLLDVDGEALLVHQNRIDFDDYSAVDAMRYVLRADLPEGTRRMTMVVRDAESGLWGAAPMQEPTDAIAGPSFSAVRVSEYEGTYYELTHRAGAPPPNSRAATGSSGTPPAASSDPTGDSPPARAASRPASQRRAGEPQIIRIVPPRDQPVSGGTTVYTLTSSQAVDAVRFELDGVEIQTDRRKPYRARIPFDSPPRIQTLRVVALDSRGLPMGEDVALINEIDRPFRVRFTDFQGDPSSGSVIVEAKVSIPAGAGLARVEFWRGEELVKTFTTSGPSYRLDMATPDAGPDDYLRVAAYLTDGTSIDDVLLLAAPTAVEEVEVNLVEVHVVVTDDLGRPIVDLEPEDFEIVHHGNTQSPQSFAYAKEALLRDIDG